MLLFTAHRNANSSNHVRGILRLILCHLLDDRDSFEFTMGTQTERISKNPVYNASN